MMMDWNEALLGTSCAVMFRSGHICGAGLLTISSSSLHDVQAILLLSTISELSVLT